MDLFKLVGSIFIDNEQANNSLAKTDKQAEKVGTSFKDVAGKAGKACGAMVTGAAAVVTAVVGLADNAAKAADEIDKGSIRMGISTDKYQEFAYAAERSGVEMSTLEKAAKKLEGTDINFDEAMASIMSLGTAEERAAAAAELFGESVAYQMSPLIEQSGEDFDALTARAHELGLVMAEDDVKAGVTLGDTLSDITKALGSIVKQIGAKVAPIVQKFADMIMEFLPQIMGMVEQLTPIIEMLFEQLMPPIMELVQKIFPIAMDIIMKLVPPIAEIVGALLPMLISLIDAILPVIEPLLDLIVELLGPLMDIINVALKPLIEILSGALKAAFTAIGKVVNGVGSVFKNVWEGIKKAWDGAGKFFSDLWDGITYVFKTALNGIIWFLNKMIDGVNLLIIPLRTIIWAVGDLFGAHWSLDEVKIPNIPQLAKGGIIQQEGWTITGEKGPELQYMQRGASVVPLEKAGFLGGDDVRQELDDIKGLLKQFIGAFPQMGVYLDGTTLVGKIAPGMDRALGRIADKNGRNV